MSLLGTTAQYSNKLTNNFILFFLIFYQTYIIVQIIECLILIFRNMYGFPHDWFEIDNQMEEENIGTYVPYVIVHGWIYHTPTC